MKFILLVLFAAGILLFGCAQDSQPSAGQSAPQAQAAVSTPANIPQGNATRITSVQLAAHNVESDCWVSYKGSVYDITGFLPMHKNYQQLLVPLCGTSSQFENAFTGKHGESKVGVLTSQGTYKGRLSG